MAWKTGSLNASAKEMPLLAACLFYQNLGFLPIKLSIKTAIKFIELDINRIATEKERSHYMTFMLQHMNSLNERLMVVF